jgi:HEAT repeat protein
VSAPDPQRRSRLVELVSRYDEHPEEHRRPLIDEMDELGGIPVASELAGSADADERFAAARLMHLLPDAAHLEALSTLVHDPDPRVAAAARRALHGQYRSPEWKALVRRLADERSDARLAAAAEGWLKEGVRR